MKSTIKASSDVTLARIIQLMLAFLYQGIKK
jgi:hypothetical protein